MRAETTDPAYVDPLLGPNEYPRMVYGSNYPRLQEVKAKYDPGNLFRYAQSVKPVPTRLAQFAYCLTR